MQRFIAPCGFAVAMLIAAHGRAQNIATGSATIPAAGRADAAAPRAAAQPPRPAEVINYETIHLEKRLSAVRAIGAITLDGALDEPAWSEAPIANGFIQNDPREGSRPTYDTEVRVLYDDDALYFGVFAQDEEPDSIIVSDLKKDYNTGSSDGFRDRPRHVSRRPQRLPVRHQSRRREVGRADGRTRGARTTRTGTASGTSKTRITETGWYAEIWIPFRTLKFGDADPQMWGINFERKLRRLNEDSYWSPMPRIYDAQRVSLAGTLEGMRGLRAGKNIRVKPYALSSGSRVATRADGGRFRRAAST